MSCSISEAMEADLRLAARLRSLNRLYGGIAHDLKAPLNAMVLNLELLKTSLSDGAPEKLRQPTRQREWVAVLSGELERLSRGLDRLLAEAAPANEEKEILDAGCLLSEVAVLLGAQARQQGIELRLAPPAESITIDLNRDRLKQALVHVAVNALEAMPQGGVLGLRAVHRDQHVLLLVEDSGPGIAEDVVQKIFDLHFTTKANGTGIGLFVTRSLLEALGGRVSVLQTGPGGTTFELCLPLEDEE